MALTYSGQAYSSKAAGTMFLFSLKEVTTTGTVPTTKIEFDELLFALRTEVSKGVGIEATAVAFDADPPNVAFTMDRFDWDFWQLAKRYNPVFKPASEANLAQSQYETGDATVAGGAVKLEDQLGVLYIGPALGNISAASEDSSEGWLIVYGCCKLNNGTGNFTTAYQAKTKPTFTVEFIKNENELSTNVTAAMLSGVSGFDASKFIPTDGIPLSVGSNSFPQPDLLESVTVETTPGG